MCNEWWSKCYVQIFGCPRIHSVMTDARFKSCDRAACEISKQVIPTLEYVFDIVFLMRSEKEHFRKNIY